MTLELTELEARALRAAIQWTFELEERKQLELYDWQTAALTRIETELEDYAKD